MTSQELIFILILIVNFIIALVYLILNVFWKKDNRKSCWLRFFVMLLCPVTGPLAFFLGYVFFRLFFRREVDLADVVFSKERVKTYMHADEDRERNLVPLEEGIAITDTENLRRLMLNVARTDIQESLSAISLALDSGDSETAHYAASVLQDALNDFRANVQKNYQYMKQDENKEERPEYAHMMIEYMDQVLKQRVLTEMEQKNQVDILDDVCEMLYAMEPEKMESREFEAISMRLLEVEDYVRCRKWCDRAVIQCPNTLSTYTCQLKLYFSTGEKEAFFSTLEKLRKSGVSIDSETLELIRVFI